MQSDTLIYQRRQPWFAAFMSFILPGFGQLYNGDWNKATWLFLGFALLAVPAIAVIALYLPAGWTFPTLLLSLLTLLGLWGYSVVDAFRTARRLQAYTPKPWQRGSLYVLVWLLCSVLTLPLLIDFVRTHLVESFRIPSASMQPAVLAGDILFADKRYNRPGLKAVQRGDIAIFVYPNDRTTYYIKRIVGLPGDVMKVEGGEITVPAGEVFVLGDNRAASKDSRDFGTVPLQDVVGKARQIWFSRGDGAIRWERLGKVVE
ncbi:signal peptidase I [Thiothrix caldifontis]|uniref:Signal peptidase I n=1 Tax=Thiothrix caldifontis TaxID=525918 RepID=A0A1H3XU56_9GAMM|nr:signal peptidase I [Thiothrix caldifontis]SEA02068.1 signal peptidase I [Thiothrix caldifontis]